MSATGGKKFAIYAKTLTGSNTEILVHGSDSVSEVKAQLREKLGVNVLRLILSGKDLSEDSAPISQYGVKEEAIVIAITEKEMPCHFFFALDESGSMTGGRWNALMQSFVEFVDKRHEASKKSDIPIQDRVSVFFHETGCRVASCQKTDGETVPFDNIPLTDINSSSLVNDFRSGGNNFDNVLKILTPYLQKSEGFTPVLMFMTDGGDCGDRQLAYDRMAAIKKMIPNLRVYVTSVFTNSPNDLDGAKKLCTAAGMDVSTNYNHIEDDGSASQTIFPPSSGYSSSLRSRTAYAPMASLGAAPMPSAAPISYSEVSVQSAQRKMASHWDYVYSSNSHQA